MTAEQLVEYARYAGLRLVLTEEMVAAAVARLQAPFTCRDLAEALPRDARGRTASEYLVSLWLENLVGRGRIRRFLSSPLTYRVSP